MILILMQLVVSLFKTITFQNNYYQGRKTFRVEQVF